MRLIQKTILAAALLSSAAAFAQNAQWQLQINTQPQYQQPQPAHPVPTPPPVNVAYSVESIQAQQDARIRWGAQRGYINEPEYRRLAQMQANIEHNRRIAYGDGFFNIQEQEFVYGQLNILSAEIDVMMLNGNHAVPYFQQFNVPIPVWTVNVGWQSGRYELRSDEHHRRAYRPAPQPPVVQTPQHQQVQQGRQIQRQILRDLFDPLGIFR
jgi:hypothetical protein